MNTSIRLSKDLKDQSNQIKEHKRYIKEKERLLKVLQSDSSELINKIPEKLKKIIEETQAIREEFLKVDGIMEYQVKERRKRKGSMDSPKKKVYDAGMSDFGFSPLKKRKGQGEWDLNDGIKFKKKVEGKQIGGVKLESGLRKARHSKSVKDEWDFRQVVEVSEDVDNQVTERGVMTPSDESSSSDSFEKQHLECSFEETTQGGYNTISNFNTFDKKLDSPVSVKKPDYFKEEPRGSLIKKSKTLFLDKNSFTMNSEIFEKEALMPGVKMEAKKLKESKMTKHQLVEFYKELMPMAQSLIARLKESKSEVLTVNSRLNTFIHKLDNNLNRDYMCKRCFMKFKLVDNDKVMF